MTSRTKHPDPRLVVLLGIVLCAVIGLAVHGPIPQPVGYHQFADQRSFFGVPHFNDTFSNLPFLVVGLAGLFALRRGVPSGGLEALRPAYAIFFAGSALLLLGSGYYHLYPSDATLTWDRLPMTVAFMAFFAVVIGEHMDPRLGLRFLAPLVSLGIVSIAYWRLTDNGDGGDLRLYVLVQFLPMLLIPLIALLYRSSLRPSSYLWALLASYGLAKALEFLDQPIFNATHFISGHTLKHLAAALGITFFLIGLYRRQSAIALEAPNLSLQRAHFARRVASTE